MEPSLAPFVLNDIKKILEALMLAKTHQNLCFVVTSLSFVVLCISYFSQANIHGINNVITGCIIALGTAFVIRFFDKSSVDDEILHLQDVIGKTSIEKFQIVVTIWLPLLMSAFSTFALYYLGAKTQDITWVLVALAVSVGFQTARVLRSRSWKDA